MDLSARRLNRATLERQLLLRREPLAAAEAVRRIVAMQAQEPATPYLALWNRVAGFDPAELHLAFTDRWVVKATLMRITLHVVHAADYSDFYAAMLPRLRAARLTNSQTNAARRSSIDADDLLVPLTQFLTQPRSEIEVQDRLESLIGERNRRTWRALRTIGPIQHLPTGEPWSFGASPSFLAAHTKQPPASHEESVQRLLLRYLQGFGPATVQDCSQFTFLTRPVVLTALWALADQLQSWPGPSGARLFDVPGGPLPSEDTVPPPRLLPMWDSILLAYADRTRLVPPDYRPLIYRRNGDVLPTLLVDGYVAGVWRAVEHGIEATAFHRLDNKAWKGLQTEASALLPLLAQQEPTVYRRYGHWWSKQLPKAEVRILPG